MIDEQSVTSEKNGEPVVLMDGYGCFYGGQKKQANCSVELELCFCPAFADGTVGNRFRRQIIGDH